MRTKTLTILSILFFSTLSISYLLDNLIGYYISVVIGGLLIWAVENVLQKKHTILRNFPILGIGRWIMESLRDKVRQYFNEGEIEEVPFSKEQRSLVYRLSKNVISTIPFGSIHNMYKQGHEFLVHRMFPNRKGVYDQRFKIGSQFCNKPYMSSRINISAMSFGALSDAAIKALNMGAKKGGFAHNTGEGGISSHHLQGGDLIFQVGTGYFGCGMTIDGLRYFNEKAFKENANRPEVKMIEIKLSQGAKPGHGGILPASKNTPEISKIRGIETPYTKVESPSFHTAFNSIEEMITFIDKLRFLSNGKPIGIKLCIGYESEVISLIDKFKILNNYPDFISVDGSEGGTGSAPPEYTNHMGMPLLDGLSIVTRNLKYYGLQDEIKVIASGKIINTFDMVKVLSLGASGVNIARGFMFSLGCIQARECNLNKCPVGVATQQKHLVKGLVVEDKFERVYNYHHNTIHRLTDIVGTMGVGNIGEIPSESVTRRMYDDTLKTLNNIHK